MQTTQHALLVLNFASYFATSLALWVVSLYGYVHLTPYREFELVRQGNRAAALSLSGTALGLALPLASLAANAVSLGDLALWAVLALVVQLLMWFALSRTVFTNLKTDITNGNCSVGLVLGGFSTAIGLLNAACLTY